MMQAHKRWVRAVLWAMAGLAAIGCGDNGKGDTRDATNTGSGGGSGRAGTGAGASGGGTDAAAGGASGGAPSALDGGKLQADSGSPAMGHDASDGGPALPEGIDCSPRPVMGDAAVHFHHIHFNTTDPDADIEFFDMFLDAPGVDFCNDEQHVTRATVTERGYFLYTQVETAPDPALNTYLEHVGWIHPDPTGEMQRLAALGAPFYPEGRFQCPEAAMGMSPCIPSFGNVPYWFYLMAPSGARIEVALGPGPASSGFGHVHLIMGEDLSFFEQATGGAFRDGAIDMVNHTDVSLMESALANETVVETRGKPIDHIGYSTTDLEAEHARILAAGLRVVEDISFKPEYGFRSFFLSSPKGIWIELVEDSPFEPQ